LKHERPEMVLEMSRRAGGSDWQPAARLFAEVRRIALGLTRRQFQVDTPRKVPRKREWRHTTTHPYRPRHGSSTRYAKCCAPHPPSIAHAAPPASVGAHSDHRPDFESSWWWPSANPSAVIVTAALEQHPLWSEIMPSRERDYLCARRCPALCSNHMYGCRPTRHRSNMPHGVTIITL
jgi:hypothetical protein